MHPNGHSSIIHNGQDTETTEVPFGRLDKEDVVHTYNGIYYPAIRKDEILPFATIWMDLEIII